MLVIRVEPLTYVSLSIYYRVHLIDDLSFEDLKKCYRGSVSTRWHTIQFHYVMRNLYNSDLKHSLTLYSCFKMSECQNMKVYLNIYSVSKHFLS